MLYKAASVTDEPEITLKDWAIIWAWFEGENPSLHFVGTRVDDSRGRVSSPIVEFQPDKKQGHTRSGRIYKLEGESAGIPEDSYAEYVWNHWAQINVATGWKDVSKDIFTVIETGGAIVGGNPNGSESTV